MSRDGFENMSGACRRNAERYKELTDEIKTERRREIS
jgi:hypothetical protein